MNILLATQGRDYSYNTSRGNERNEQQEGTGAAFGNEAGTLFFKRDKGPGITVWNSHWQGKDEAIITCWYEPFFVGLHAMLDGSVTLTAPALESTTVHEKELILGRLHNIVATFCTTPMMKMRSIHVCYSKAYFKAFVQACPSFSSLLANTSSPCLVTDEPVHLHDKMLNIVTDLVNNNFTEDIRRHYIFLKAQELLLHVGQQILNVQERKNSNANRLNAELLASMYRIADLLAENITTRYTIPQLARLFGMNAMRLKRSFKIVFDQSIHQYIIKLQLNRAYLLITSTDLPITEIAYQTGFSSKHHFSNSFKKHFGSTPTAIRNKGVSKKI